MWVEIQQWVAYDIFSVWKNCYFSEQKHLLWLVLKLFYNHDFISSSLPAFPTCCIGDNICDSDGGVGELICCYCFIVFSKISVHYSSFPFNVRSLIFSLAYSSMSHPYVYQSLHHHVLTFFSLNHRAGKNADFLGSCPIIPQLFTGYMFLFTKRQNFPPNSTITL